MYICRNCGLKYPVDAAVLCVRCQTPKGMGNQFCPCCGNPMPPVAQICMNCGVDTTQYGMPESEKSKVAAGLFGIFFGSLGVHNFYLGYTVKAVIQLVSFLAGMIFYVGGILFIGVSDTSTAATFLAIFGFFVVVGIEIWAWIEGILILCGKINCDGQGRRIVK